MVKENKKRSNEYQSEKERTQHRILRLQSAGNIDLPDLLWTGHAI